MTPRLMPGGTSSIPTPQPTSSTKLAFFFDVYLSTISIISLESSSYIPYSYILLLDSNNFLSYIVLALFFTKLTYPFLDILKQWLFSHNTLLSFIYFIDFFQHLRYYQGHI